MGILWDIMDKLLHTITYYIWPQQNWDTRVYRFNETYRKSLKSWLANGGSQFMMFKIPDVLGE